MDTLTTLQARVGALETERDEFRTRIEALEARFGAIEQQLVRHGRLLMLHEEHLTKMERESLRQFDTIRSKLDLIMVALEARRE